MSVVLITLLVFVIGIVSLPWVFRAIVQGKVFCYWIENDGYLSGKLKVPVGDFILDGEGAYNIRGDRVGLTTYPKGLPKVFRVVVPCFLYMRDDCIPLDMKAIASGQKILSAKETKAVLEGDFIKNLVAHAREGGPEESKLAKMVPWVSAGVGIIALVMIFLLWTRIGGLERAVSLLP